MGPASSLPFWRRRVPGWRWALWGVAAAIALGAGLSVRARMNAMAALDDTGAGIDGRQTGGTLVIAGGGELPHQVQQRFLELAGGASARIVILPAFPADEEIAANYREAWAHFGAAEAVVLVAGSRDDAFDESFSAAIDQATGVWLGGGQQSWLAERYRGTPVERRLRDLLERGGVVGGTSAGAACLCDVMIAGGRQTPHLARGFALWNGVVVDQHFLRRNRWQRMQQTLEAHPEVTGFGIDEETALIVERGTGRFSVLGKSYVVACVPAIEGRRPRIEFLRAGDTFDLRSLRDGSPLGMHPTEFEALLMGE